MSERALIAYVRSRYELPDRIKQTGKEGMLATLKETGYTLNANKNGATRGSMLTIMIVRGASQLITDGDLNLMGIDAKKRKAYNRPHVCRLGFNR